LIALICVLIKILFYLFSIPGNKKISAIYGEVKKERVKKRKSIDIINLILIIILIINLILLIID